MVAERLYLHIGAEKTGTTSIQRTLERMRPKLAGRGVLFPQTPGAFNHIALAAYGMDDRRGIDEMRIIAGVASPAELPAFRDKLARDLSDEIEASSAHTVILSNEHLSSRLLQRREVRRLRDLLAPLAREIRVVLYIREPVAFFASWYSTSVASGSTRAFPQRLPRWMLSTADWAALSQRWATVFGDEALILRRMDPEHLIGEEVVPDFFDAVGLGDVEPPRLKPLNQSLPRKSLLLLRELNRHIPRVVDGQMNAARNGLVPALRRWPETDRFRIGAAQAAQIAEHFEPSYQWLRARWFPDCPGPLFSPPPVAGNTDASEEVLDPADICALTAHLWKNRG